MQKVPILNIQFKSLTYAMPELINAPVFNILLEKGEDISKSIFLRSSLEFNDKTYMNERA